MPQYQARYKPQMDHLSLLYTFWHVRQHMREEAKGAEPRQAA